ncbi:MAG: hypothetical protein DRH26_03125 [Deltaproteobacteria bacterium]|nr:MAG: hypothetical protein DRH26_03125 [Deltaproteobacteria bacterium]
MDVSTLKEKVLNGIKSLMNTDLNYSNTKACLNFITLEFSKSESHLEKDFQEKFFHSNIAHLRNCHFYTILFYVLAGFIDYYLFPEDLLSLFTIRFLLVVPVFLLGYFFSFTVWYKKTWKQISFFYILLTGSSFIAFTAIGHAPEAYDYWVGILFCMVFGYTFIREPFIYASTAGSILLIIYLLNAIVVTKIPTDKLIISFFYLLLINFLGMLISRHLEFSARKDFFLEQILFIEKKKVLSLNNELERKVNKRTSELNSSNRLLKTKIGELNKSETIHRNFVDNAPIGMCTMTLNGKFTYINKKLEEITGYKAKDWLGKPFHLIVYPDDLEVGTTKFNSRIKGDVNPESYQIRIINSQNEILWVKITSESIIEEKNGIKKITEIQSFIEDVTKVQRSQDINKTLFAISNAVNTTKNLYDLYKQIHNLLGRIIDVTNFFIAIVNEKEHTLYFPYSVDTVDDDFSPLTDFDPQESLTGLVVSTQKPLLLKKNKLQKLADRSGVWGPVPLIWMGVPLVVKDEIIGVIVVQSYTDSDIYTEQDLEVLISISDQVAVAIDRKGTGDELSRSEEKFRTAFKTSPHVITLTRIEDGLYIDINDAFTKLLGYSPEEIIGKSSIEHNIWNDLKDRDRLVSGLKDAGLVENLHADFKGKEGQIVNGLMSARILDIGNKEYLLAVTQDMTKLKKIEQERLDLEIRLQQAQKMEAIGTLAGGIAHDFNNILSGIFGYSQLVMQNIDNVNKIKHYIAQIDKGSKRAAELVRQILTFSRQDVYKKHPLQISFAIKEALQLLRPSIPTSIEIKQMINSKSAVLADPIKIHQLTINLCTNAYHAIGENQGRITITLADINIQNEEKTNNMLVPPGDYLELEVTDTGSGMDKSMMDKIFDPYFTTKQSSQGTGLGLALVKAIAKEHEGFVRVDSVPGQGTSFFVYLPILEKKPDRISSASPKPKHLGGNERIMVVDDEEAIRNISEEILQAHGYTVRSFKNGYEAFTHFKRDPHKYDLVITDMTMPKMSGDKLAIEMLKNHPDIPVLICTGFSETLTKEKASAIGIKRILNKPLAMNDLLKNIREILDENKN